MIKKWKYKFPQKSQKIPKNPSEESGAKNGTKKSLCREEYSFAANSLRYETMSYLGDFCANTRANTLTNPTKPICRRRQTDFVATLLCCRWVPCLTRTWSEVTTTPLAGPLITPTTAWTRLFCMYTWLCGGLEVPKLVKLLTTSILPSFTTHGKLRVVERVKVDKALVRTRRRYSGLSVLPSRRIHYSSAGGSPMKRATPNTVYRWMWHTQSGWPRTSDLEA